MHKSGIFIAQEVKDLFDFQTREEQEEAVQLVLCGKHYELKVICFCVILKNDNRHEFIMQYTCMYERFLLYCQMHYIYNECTVKATRRKRLGLAEAPWGLACC